MDRLVRCSQHHVRAVFERDEGGEIVACDYCFAASGAPHNTGCKYSTGVFVKASTTDNYAQLQRDIEAARGVKPPPLQIQTGPAFQRQEGGSHYTKLKIQPMEYSMANGLNAGQHTVVKYVTRYKDKGGVDDLRKAIHTLELMIELEQREEPKTADGWVEWHGGSNPAGDARVQIKIRKGGTRSAICEAFLFRWNHLGGDSDIIAYRIV